jgi:UDP-N-acetylglucosamine--N-acetylmuramyl-(pentapeptide) pyrophosphoryl-undecaprenol N-acetylglucosamine transferase
MKVLVTGGGTGGHINPALAIASIVESHEPNTEVLYVGTPFGMEARLVPQANYNFEPIKVTGFQRKLTLKNVGRNIKTLAYLTTAGHRAKEILTNFKPDVVIGTGGYVCGPVVQKAAQMGIPTAIHEQNAYPGMTNKILSKQVDKVMLTVKEAMDYFDKDINYVVTGLPVRSELVNKSKQDARRELGFNDNFTILSFGGSLGAGCINDTMAEVIKWSRKEHLNINHIHGYGGMGKESFPKAMQEANINMVGDGVRITEYINDMDTCLSACDLVVCRSGASTLAEIEAVGRASILIPSPNVAGNHQYYNAMVLGKANASIVMEQKDVTPEKVIDRIRELYQNPAKVEEMSLKAKSCYVNDTNEKIWNAIQSILK